MVALCGFVASSVGIFFALLMQQPRGNVRAGLVCYNAALFGSVLPALALGPNPWAEPLTVWIAVVLGAIFT